MNKLDALLKENFSEAELDLLLGPKCSEDLEARVEMIKKRRQRAEKSATKTKRKFTSHPKRLLSDSDVSGGVASPKFVANSFSSSDSRVDLLYQNQNFRRTKSCKGKKNRGSSSEGCGSLVQVKANLKGDACGDAPVQPRKGECVEAPAVKVAGGRRSEQLVSRPKIDVPKRNKTAKAAPAKVVENPQLKLKNLLEKINFLLTDIGNFVDADENEPDGDEDLERRSKRALEFSTRFSRNYLYELGRFLGDLEVIVNLKTAKPLSQQHHDFSGKLVACHQIVLQALVAYKKHMPTSTVELTFEKLNMLLNNTLQLCTLHRNSVNWGADLGIDTFCKMDEWDKRIEEFEAHVNIVMEKISSHRLGSTGSLLKSRMSTKISLSVKRSNDNRRRTAMNSKLSMYMIPSASNKWKKQMAQLPKKKFNVRSRYKEATFKHRPPATIIEPIPKHKFVEKRSSCVIKDTPPFTPIKEDNIETLVANEGAETRPLTEKVGTDELEPLVALMNDFIKKKNGENCEDADQEQLQSFLVHLAGLVREKNDEKAAPNGATDCNANTIAGEEPQMTGDDVPPLILTKNAQQQQKANQKKPSVHKSDHTADPGSLSECSSSKEREENDSVKEGVDMEVCCSQLIYKEREPPPVEANENKRNGIKIGRLARVPKKPLRLLAKDSIMSIVQYKFQFHKHTKASHMYKKSTTIQPWVLTGKISDKLLDYLLLEVAREIEVNEILESLYQSEFQ